MTDNLFLCNTVYQVLVATWIQYSEFKSEKSDIIISNHMNGYKKIADNIKKVDLFDKVYTVDSLDYTKGNFAYKNRFDKYFCIFNPNYKLNKYIRLDGKYNRLLVGNSDNFSALLYSALYKQSSVELCFFEDGISTYSELFKRFYTSKIMPDKKLIRMLYKIFNIKTIYPNAEKFLVFNKNAMTWNTGCGLQELKPVSCEDEFKQIVNKIYDYDNMKDIYDKKYIFFEESFYADSGYMEDVELVEKIADVVGKENIMIKIHPRNPVNRFEKLGYKTNHDTFIPWEVISMNIDSDDKIFLTVASSSVVNPKILFGNKSKTYSFINCLNEKPALLKSALTKCVLSFYDKYDTIIMVNGISGIGDI